MKDYTPGDWYVRWKDDGYPKMVRTGSRGVAAPIWADEKGEPNKGEAAANARLIAAAPELLEQLKAIHDARWQNSRGGRDPHEAGERPEWCNSCEIIAKVEGDDA